MKKPPKTDLLSYVAMLEFYEMGQYSADIIAEFDIILNKIWNSNIYIGGVLIIFSVDHT